MSALDRLSDMPVGQVALISGAICLVYYLALYDNGAALEGRISQAAQSKTEMEGKLRKVEQDLKEIETLKEAQQKDSERLNFLLGFIPEKVSKIQMMQTISNEAKTVGVNLNQLRNSMGQEAKGEFYEEVGVDVEINGSFSQLMLFLSNLTRLNQILTLDSLDLRTGSVPDSDALTMNASVRGYRYVPKKTAGEVK